ncbi:uncharacterized protein LOC122070942 [Macadamia integrifolia]|uniref:uncharacterized protein LOC122070942 n=1 Tax=Macadamia integrifolia TaxID=60698 RepID=UPI001C4E4DDC|nr:uncharacterized protein LOC122070942 [Macadamia integrifolia]XP_042491126.1 uncharacterized protein LOC122070942 [Macadamia integrifolia]
MVQVLRPLSLKHWPFVRLQRHYYRCSGDMLRHLILPPLSPFRLSLLQQQQKNKLFYATLPSSRRDFGLRSQGLRLPEAGETDDLQEGQSESDYLNQKSRNEKKREARRAVRWGMELATFSTPQIKQILRVASLDREVFDALMLVKRFGPDVREGKRRQFNYIGRQLRNVQPELMDALIQASKDGDQSKLQALSGTRSLIVEEEDEEEWEETKFEEEEEGCSSYIDVATRWFEGLIEKDSDITNEVYSVHSVEFDRQELRKLVRQVHSMQERQVSEEKEGEVDMALARAKKSLTHFLRTLAKQLSAE